ncbi:MAG: adenosylcobinamide-GDP ribazoletransferase [Clostridiales bacterium]|jgi:adenosylcobinamide-GDP ribazoletransferase|nr:adenosylcobinamide-GDP ribazoletransferase [Clostridiales bacterium]
MKDGILGFLMVLSFFTRIPIGRKIPYDESIYRKGLYFFPMMGWVIGALLLVPMYLFKEFPMIKPLMILLVYLMVTGGIHLDGLADSCDGLLSGREKDKILEIMKDSRLGTFGAVAIVFYLLFSFVLMGDLRTIDLFWMPFIGRSSAFILAGLSRYARKEGGMGAVFIETIGERQAVIASVGVLALSLFVLGWLGLLAVVFSGVVLLGIGYWANSKIGGITGDILGMAVEVTQIVFMLCTVLFRA